MTTTEGSIKKPGSAKWGVPFEEVYKDELGCVRHRWKAVYGEEAPPSEGETKDKTGEEAAAGQAAEAGKKKKRQRAILSNEPSTDNELVGLAFSGGGIRSATINMGIAQALHRRGVFDHVDYMSTVSGGGYLGSSISTAMRADGEFPYEYQDPKAPADETAIGEPKRVETKFLTWVRNNSNYMATGGFLDWPRIFGVLLRGILANFLVLLPILLVLAVLLVWGHGYKLADWEVKDQAIAAARETAAESAAAAELAEKKAIGGDDAAWERAAEARARAETDAAEADRLAAEAPSGSSFFFWSLVAAGLFLLAVFVFPVLIRVYKVYHHGEEEESSVDSRGGVEKAFGIVLVVIAVAAALEAMPLLMRWFHRFESSGLRGLYTGAGSGGALAVLTLAGKALSKLGGLRQKVMMMLVGLLGLVLPLVVALYVADDLIYQPQVAVVGEDKIPTPAYAVTAHDPMELTKPIGEGGWIRLLPGVLLIIMGGGTAAAGVGKILTRGKKKEKKKSGIGGSIFVLLGTLVGAAVGYAVLIGLTQALAWLCGLGGISGIRPDFLILGMALIVVFYCWAAIDVNLTAVLGLYRDRLAAAYLIGLRKADDEDNESGEDEIFVEPDLNLEKLCGGMQPEEKTTRPGKRLEENGQIKYHAPATLSKAPYHLVNTALNLQGSDDKLLRDRGSDFFMFSKLYYGGHRTGYCETWRLEKVFPQMDLPTAMAISAAAASPNSGRMTSKPLVALMTLLNVRLGYWVPHPGRLFDWLKEAKITNPKLLDRWGWRIPPQALLREMASSVNEDDKWVNLSDGGHLENMAVYELLRRRCKYIICGDGEADPDLSFGGLATLMRSARIDLGIEIDILLDDLRLGTDRTSAQHAALGKIKYPPRKEGDKEETGYLLYIKSSFTGNEDETMQEYRAKSGDFPHESTADQFFDEGQFEAYRALGFHMADGLFPPWVDAERSKVDWTRFRTWFHDLRADLAPRLSSKHVELQEQLRLIQETLVQPDYRDYYIELHPDLAAAETAGTGDPKKAGPLTPEICYMVGQQLTLMENAFVALNLDQPRNWKHEGNQGWRALFENWAQSDRFARAYEHLGHLHSGRFQNFCFRNFGLPDAGKLWKMEQDRKKKRAATRKQRKG